MPFMEEIKHRSVEVIFFPSAFTFLLNFFLICCDLFVWMMISVEKKKKKSVTIHIHSYWDYICMRRWQGRKLYTNQFDMACNWIRRSRELNRQWEFVHTTTFLIARDMHAFKQIKVGCWFYQNIQYTVHTYILFKIENAEKWRNWYTHANKSSQHNWQLFNIYKPRHNNVVETIWICVYLVCICVDSCFEGFCHQQNTTKFSIRIVVVTNTAFVCHFDGFQMPTHGWKFGLMSFQPTQRILFSQSSIKYLQMYKCFFSWTKQKTTK